LEGKGKKGYKRDIGDSILSLCYGSSSLVSLSFDNLNVLRVLSEQTLEISKEVKYSFVIDPRLVKVVKDSTLTILL
jgi:hypothetical protein